MVYEAQYFIASWRIVLVLDRAWCQKPDIFQFVLKEYVLTFLNPFELLYFVRIQIFLTHMHLSLFTSKRACNLRNYH